MTLPGLGWRPDPHDPRDQLFGAERGVGAPLPRESRLYERVPRWRDQGRTNSCVGHAVVAALELRRLVDGAPDVPLSPAHAYWLARALNGFQYEDGGAFIRSGIRAGVKLGFAREDLCPLEEARINERPNAGADADGITKTIAVYERIVATGDARIEAALLALADDCPIVAGKIVTRSYVEHRGSGVLPPPRLGDVELGGHATIIAGHRTELGGSYSLAEAGSWLGWGVAPGQSLGWVAAEWLHSCIDLAVIRRASGGAHA